MTTPTGLLERWNTRSCNSFNPLPVEEFSDAADGDYQGTESPSSTSSSDSGIKEITNEEAQ